MNRFICVFFSIQNKAGAYRVIFWKTTDKETLTITVILSQTTVLLQSGKKS